MLNKRMEEDLNSGRAIDVNKIGVILRDGTWKLNTFIANVGYCDARNEIWIQSIGRRLSDGSIYAAVNTMFKDREGYECLYLA